MYVSIYKHVHEECILHPFFHRLVAHHQLNPWNLLVKAGLVKTGL